MFFFVFFFLFSVFFFIFFFLMIRRPPRSTPFPTRRSSDLQYSTCLVDSEAHGRTQVRLLLGDMEYWTCSADPERDQPIRELALAEADGDAWQAMRRLVDPAWHHDRAHQLLAPGDVDVDVEISTRDVD